MLHDACNVARFYEITHVKGVKRNKNMYNRLDLTCLFLMSKMSTVLYTIYIHSMVHFKLTMFELSMPNLYSLTKQTAYTDMNIDLWTPCVCTNGCKYQL